MPAKPFVDFQIYRPVIINSRNPACSAEKVALPQKQDPPAVHYKKEFEQGSSVKIILY